MRLGRSGGVRAPEQQLTLGRIYILPTRNGVLLGLVLAAMLVGATNYASGLAYALTFLLGSLAIVSIFHTYANMAGLTVRTGRCRPVFAGEQALFPLAVDNRGRNRYSLALEAGDGQAITDLPALTLRWVELPQPTSQRGWCELGPVTLASTHPLGLFRAWSYLHLQQRCLVYPRPEAVGPLPAGSHGSDKPPLAGHGHEDFAALRDYRAGDSLRHVHWKALAREQGLLTKQFEGGGGDELWFEWKALEGLDPEARLARLCRWILWADSQGCTYGVALPDRRIERGSGPAQRQHCLEALALYDIANR